MEIGRKILPEATWICGSVFDLADMNLGYFDTAIGNPPFGNVQRHGGNAPRFTGREFEYHVIDIASDIADAGTFIIPQMSAPFRFSGVQCYDRNEHRRYSTFKEQTGIEMDAGCGIDTSLFRDQWKGAAPAVEIVCADFVEARQTRKPAQADLFSVAA